MLDLKWRHGRLALALATLVAFAGCKSTAPSTPTVTLPPAETPTAVTTPQASPAPLPPLFDDLERRSFNYFWELGNPANGMVPDRWPSKSFASIAAIGFGLTTYGVGAERGWITRDQAIERTLATLRFFDRAPQGAAAEGMSGYKGFFYHFIKMDTGARDAKCELSTVDTTLLLGGMLFSQSYFDRATPAETEIRELAERIYRRVEWDWAQVRAPKISMGWSPEKGAIAHDWNGYNEALLVYILALASPTHPVGEDAYAAWTSTYDKQWGTFHGQEHLSFAPLFGHQYSHVWLDLRGVQDDYMRGRGIDYFENSRRAVLSQRAYAIANPQKWEGYGANVWGLTASDGPIDATLDYKGEKRLFHTYTARGAGIEHTVDDGTIVPTAAAASLPFAPEVVIPAVTEMHQRYGEHIYQQYGFIDAFNPSFHYDVPLHHGKVVKGMGWMDNDYIGIDQGPIVLMIENHRSELVWKVMRKNPHIRRGLERAGFTGGWLAAPATGAAPTVPAKPAAVPVPATAN
ncbi:MAG: Tat pathway signal protein [Gammaproteobacteria bacterium RIFCSPHIGHO2_12_FULL_63_22]|nr:MAG: Tat pathway signal protein [Gammaproteobacteria bacterium RIFCSPHIGHO2_12_FULL_63_22]